MTYAKYAKFLQFFNQGPLLYYIILHFTKYSSTFANLNRNCSIPKAAELLMVFF